MISGSMSAQAQSGLCGANVPFYHVNMSGNPDSVYISPQDVRRDTCCGAVSPDRCIEFEMILDTGAIGIRFDIYSGAQPPGALFYQINCGTPVPVGNIICLSGRGPHTLTFCKPGNNPNQYAITSIPGVTLLPDKFTIEGCSTMLEVSGLVDSTVIWRDITSGNGYYNDFLNCDSGCLTTGIATEPGFPSYIDFQVCGTIFSSQCPTLQNHICDTLRLFINPNLRVSITTDTPPICGGDTSRLFTANVMAQTGIIRYLWFDAFDGGGTIIGNDSFFLATLPGDYSVIAYDTLFPTCSRDTANISVYFNLKPSIFISGDDTICEGDAAMLHVIGANKYSWMPSSSLSCDTCASVFAFPVATTLYHVLATDTNGCAAVDSFLLSVIPVQTTQIPAVICEGDSFLAGGAYQNTSGLYFDTLLNILSCDSVIQTSLTVISHSRFTRSVGICEGDSFFAGGGFQHASGIYFDTLASSSGCDSIIQTEITVLDHSSFTRTVGICEGDSLLAGGGYQTSSGTYYDTLTALNGCDSVVATELIINYSAVINQSVTVCFGQPYNGVIYANNTVLIDSIVSASGCDSIIFTQLSLDSFYLFTVNAVICQGDSFYAGGEYRFSPGSYYDTFPTAHCDSMIRTDLEVLTSGFLNLNEVICEGDSIFFAGTVYSATGVYYNTLIATNSCDSLIQLHLFVIPKSVITNEPVICAGDEYAIGNSIYSVPGLYIDTLVSSTGCDSIIFTDLKVSWLEIEVNPAIDTIRLGESVQLNVTPVSANYQLIWQPVQGLSCPDCPSPLASPRVTTDYSIVVIDANGCTDTNHVRIIVTGDTLFHPNECFNSIYFPNAFSPNGDGINDLFYVYGNGIEEFHLLVYNRWGEKVFESFVLNFGWDGTYRGKPQNPGVYVYYAEIAFCEGRKLPENQRYFKGSVTLIR